MNEETKIIASSIGEAIDRALLMIREKSRAFYATSIAEDLARSGRAIVDRHAGMGRYLIIETYEDAIKQRNERNDEIKKKP